MNLVSSSIIFVFNTSLCCLATLRIIRAFPHSKYRPRLITLLIITWSSMPNSVLEVATDATKGAGLDYYVLCYSFVVFKNFSFFKHLLVPNLGFFVSLCLFTKLGRKRLNEIASLSNWVLVAFWFIYIPVLVCFMGVKLSHPKATGGAKACSRNSTFLFGHESVVVKNLGFVMAVISALFFFYLILSKLLRKKIKLATSKQTAHIRIAGSFFFMSLINISSRYFDSWLDKRFTGNTSLLKDVVYDILKGSPGFFALVVLLLEKPQRFSPKHFPLEKLMSLAETRTLLFDFAKRNPYTKLKRVLTKWEKVNKSTSNIYFDEEIDRCERTELLIRLEKECELVGLYDFYLSDPFIDYYYKYRKTGEVEMGLDFANKN